jgi:hypothetical protein
MKAESAAVTYTLPPKVCCRAGITVGTIGAATPIIKASHEFSELPVELGLELICFF